MLGCDHLLAIMNNKAINIWVQIFVWISFILGIYPFAESVATPGLIIWGIARLFSKLAATLYIPTSRVWVFLFLHILLNSFPTWLRCHMVIFNDRFFLLQRACKLHSGIFSRILPSITKFSSFQVVKIFFLRDSGLCLAPALIMPILQTCPNITISQRSLCTERNRRLGIHLCLFLQHWENFA